MRRITYALFLLLLTEIALGGGGRLLAWGPVSLRMILFALAMGLSAIITIREKRIPGDYKLLLLFFAITMMAGFLRGIYNGAQRIYWWEDVKPLLYFLILPFFAIAVTENTVIKNAASIIKLSALIQAIVFFILIFLLYIGWLPFQIFYKPAIQSGEFFFRGELTFFYKGFLYLCVGFIFFHFTGERNKWFVMTFVLLAIVLTFTRGFLLALCLTYAVYYFTKRLRLKAAAAAVAAVLILFFGQAAIGQLSQLIDIHKNTHSVSADSQRAHRYSHLGNRKFSDSERMQQIKEVFNGVTPVSFFIGHGFGVGTPGRPIHMEISYLEILHKQGLLGLAFWGYLFWLLVQKYRAAPDEPIRNAFFFGTLFIFFQSLTNQFINNPIGLSMALLTLICLDVMNKKNALSEEGDHDALSNQKSAKIGARSS
jgi:hypothetical protein